jgi:hypothetical protein
MAGRERYNHAHDPVLSNGAYSSSPLEGSIVFKRSLSDIHFPAIHIPKMTPIFPGMGLR